MFGSTQFDVITTTEIDRYLVAHHRFTSHLMGRYIEALVCDYSDSNISIADVASHIDSDARAMGIDIGGNAIGAYIDTAALSNRMRLYLVAHWALHTDTPPDADDLTVAAAKRGCDVSYNEADTFLMSATSFVGYVTEKTGR